MPYIAVAFLRDVSYTACALFSNLLDELRRFIGAPRRQQDFRHKVKFIALHLGMLHRTIEGNNNIPESQDDGEVSIGSENGYGNYYTHDCQKLIARRLFPKKDSALEQLRRVGLGFDHESFQVGCGCKAISSVPPLISLKVSRLSMLLPVDTRLNFSSEHAKIDASPMSLTTFSTTNKEETAERPSHNEQHKVICTAEKVPSDSYHSLLSTEGDDTQEFPASSRLASDILSEQKQDLVCEETKVRLRLLQSELDEVSRDIDSKRTRQVELENLIAWTHLFPDSVLMDDEDSQYCSESRNRVKDAGVLSSTSNCFDSVPDSGCESMLPGLLDDRLPSANAVSFETTLSNAQIEGIDFNWHFASPTADETKTKRTSQMSIIESFETPNNPNIQSNEVKMDGSRGKTPSKRLRVIFSGSSKGHKPLSSISTAFIPDSEAAFTQAWHEPSTFKDRNRLSRVLLGQLSALQVTGGGIHDQGGNEVPPEDPDRPASYPRTQRWRKSIGVSVKALREGFERLSLLRKEKRDSQTHSMVIF